MRPSSMLVLLTAVTACSRCDGDSGAPSERVAPPLPISGVRSDQAPAGDGAPGDAGARAETGDASAARVGVGNPSAATAASPQPARALELAARADEAGAGGDIAAAVEGYDLAVAASGDEPWLRVARAWYLSRLGRVLEARDDLDRALDLTDNRDQLAAAAALHGLGELHQSRSDLARAQDAYRQGLRSWAGAPLARALLGVTPSSSEQLTEIERLAHGESVDLIRRLGVSRGRGGAEVLAATEMTGGEAVLVLATPRASSAGFRLGASFRLVVIGPESPVDAGATTRELVLGESSLIRWHLATARVVAQGDAGSSVLVTVESTGPGAGAPMEATTTLVEIRRGTPTKLLARPVERVRDAPLGCRRGWREELTFEVGDGAVGSLGATKVMVVTPRIPFAEGVCTAEERRQPPQVVSLPSAPE